VATQRWRCDELVQRRTLWVNCASKLLTFSMQLVVRKESLSIGISPNRWSVRVSSKPFSRLLRADWFISFKPGLSASSAALAAAYVGLP